MDVWHWTSLVVLLSYAGLVSIPDAYYQAAKIDGASNWSVFRYIQLPKMKRVLTIAVLLRFMDSFNIYTEPFVLTGGGPGNSTTLLSIDLVKIALGQFDLGPAAAMSPDLLRHHPAGELAVLYPDDEGRREMSKIIKRTAELRGLDDDDVATLEKRLEQRAGPKVWLTLAAIIILVLIARGITGGN